MITSYTDRVVASINKDNHDPSYLVVKSISIPTSSGNVVFTRTEATLGIRTVPVENREVELTQEEEKAFYKHVMKTSLL